MIHPEELCECKASLDELSILPSARRLPVWAMGLSSMPYGFVCGFASTAMGILLIAHGVTVGRIGIISTIAFSPTFWGWLLSPVLDVHFTKRTYAFAMAILAAVTLGACILLLGHLTWFTVLLTLSCLCAVLYVNAAAGWAADAIENAEYNTLSGWSMVGNLGAAGLFGALVVVLVRQLPMALAAALVAMLVFAPALLLQGFPAPRVPSSDLRENFRAMRRDLMRAGKEPRLWVGLVIFLSPVGAFALTNLFSSMGADFNVSERTVTALNGPAVATTCSAACLLGIPLCRVFSRRMVYLLAGVAAAICALTMAFCPHTPTTYVVGVLAYNACQGFNYTAFAALALEIVGPGNALAGTMMAVLNASINVPISAMTWIDSQVHDAHGLRGMFAVDAGSSALTAVLLFTIILPMMIRRRDAAPHSH